MKQEREHSGGPRCLSTILAKLADGMDRTLLAKTQRDTSNKSSPRLRRVSSCARLF